MPLQAFLNWQSLLWITSRYQFALRHEELEDTSTTDPPKSDCCGLSMNNSACAVSFGTAFRAPSLFQVFGSTNAPLRLSTQGNSTISQLTTVDPNNPLQPEEADVYKFWGYLESTK